jgi:hypothetical protein
LDDFDKVLQEEAENVEEDFIQFENLKGVQKEL